KRETGNVERIGDVELYIDQSDLDDRNQIGALMDAFRASHKRAISVLFTNGDRPGVHVAVTDDLVERGVKAGEIASAIAAVGGGFVTYAFEAPAEQDGRGLAVVADRVAAGQGRKP